MTPKEIEAALKAKHTTFDVNAIGTRLTAVLRPDNSSRSFVLVADIHEVEEL